MYTMLEYFESMRSYRFHAVQVMERDVNGSVTSAPDLFHDVNGKYDSCIAGCRLGSMCFSRGSSTHACIVLRMRQAVHIMLYPVCLGIVITVRLLRNDPVCGDHTCNTLCMYSATRHATFIYIYIYIYTYKYKLNQRTMNTYLCILCTFYIYIFCILYQQIASVHG